MTPFSLRKIARGPNVHRAVGELDFVDCGCHARIINQLAKLGKWLRVFQKRDFHFLGNLVAPWRRPFRGPMPPPPPGIPSTSPVIHAASQPASQPAPPTQNIRQPPPIVNYLTSTSTPITIEPSSRNNPTTNNLYLLEFQHASLYIQVNRRDMV